MEELVFDSKELWPYIIRTIWMAVTGTMEARLEVRFRGDSSVGEKMPAIVDCFVSLDSRQFVYCYSNSEACSEFKSYRSRNCFTTGSFFSHPVCEFHHWIIHILSINSTTGSFTYCLLIPPLDPSHSVSEFTTGSFTSCL